jgi:hypothetical protein
MPVHPDRFRCLIPAHRISPPRDVLIQREAHGIGQCTDGRYVAELGRLTWATLDHASYDIRCRTRPASTKRRDDGIALVLTARATRSGRPGAQAWRARGRRATLALRKKILYLERLGAMTAAKSPRVHDAYRDLSELLLGVLADGRDPREAGRASGRLIAEAARGSHPGAPDDVLAALEGFLASRGFMPEMVAGRPGIEFRLGCCPFAEAALVNPALVCGLHRAIAEGVLEALGGDFEVTRLVARHPLAAGCRLELRAVRPGTT